MSKSSLPALTLVLGGVSSGKSEYAERLIFADGRPRTYIATSVPFDDGSKAKIAAHRVQRGPDWLTIEEPLNPSAVLTRATAGHVILLDCTSVWIGNLMHDRADMDVAFETFLTAAKTCAAPLVIVGNEVGLGGVSPNMMARDFADLQGQLNQSIAALADQVIFVAAGLPLTMKG